jgi:tRNA (guanine37-N1)-methyltransferase
VRVDIFTLFPEMFAGPFDNSILKRAVNQGKVDFKIHNIRDYTHDKHHTADDYSYGGGAGMVMKPEPVFEAVESVRSQAVEMEGKKLSIILLTPQGRLFNQSVANELVEYDWLMLICGHYEGLDERIREHLVNDEISIGDYVLTGGELASMVIADAVVRLIPGVLGSGESLLYESHTGGLLEYPQYTRPEVFRDWEVPEVLCSGNHALIAKWRREQAILRTVQRRPDLLKKAKLTLEEKEIAADYSAKNKKSRKQSKK